MQRVWLVFTWDAMRIAGTRADARPGCSSCAVCNAGLGRDKAPSAQPVECLLCRGRVCGACYWRAVVNQAELHEQDEFRCPVCARSHADDNTAAGRDAANFGGDVLAAAAASLQRFCELPDALDRTRPSGKARRTPPMRPLGLHQAHSEYVGATQAQRLRYWFDACAAGKLHRCAALFRAGIDIDCQDEYGRTGHYIAAVAGHRRLATELECRYGAKLSVKSNCGLDVTAALNTRQMVVRHDDPSYAPGAIPSRALEYPSPAVRWPVRPGEQPGPGVGPAGHPATGACVVDGAFADTFLEALVEAFDATPKPTATELPQCDTRHRKTEAHGHVSRRKYCDCSGRVCGAVAAVLAQSHPGAVFSPQLQFLHYTEPKSAIPPHNDLAKGLELPPTRPGLPARAAKTTHTFIVYLADCSTGATELLDRVVAGNAVGCAPAVVLARVEPRRGRLLVFPHETPHCGTAVEVPPKLLIRGQFYAPVLGAADDRSNSPVLS